MSAHKQATWVVQSNKIRTSQTLPIIEALRHQGEPFVDVGIDVQSGLLSPLDPEIGKDVIPYGSTHLVRVARAEGWRHLFYDEATFRADLWPALHPGMLNAAPIITTLSRAKVMAHDRPEWFIRPVGDLKEFSGHVIASDELVRWVRSLEAGDCEVTGESLVALSEPQPIDMEWRYLIVGGRIVTGSSYRFKGQPHQHAEHDADVLAEAQALADAWLPHPCCCMDVALCRGEARVVEFNTLNATGLYAHDVGAFVAAVSAYAREDA